MSCQVFFCAGSLQWLSKIPVMSSLSITRQKQSCHHRGPEWGTLIGPDHPDTVLWLVDIIVLLRQLSYAIKKQLVMEKQIRSTSWKNNLVLQFFQKHFIKYFHQNFMKYFHQLFMKYIAMCLQFPDMHEGEERHNPRTRGWSALHPPRVELRQTQKAKGFIIISFSRKKLTWVWTESRLPQKRNPFITICCSTYCDNVQEFNRNSTRVRGKLSKKVTCQERCLS